LLKATAVRLLNKPVGDGTMAETGKGTLGEFQHRMHLPHAPHSIVGFRHGMHLPHSIVRLRRRVHLPHILHIIVTQEQQQPFVSSDKSVGTRKPQHVRLVRRESQLLHRALLLRR
jgi:hypothetical protein